MSKDFSEIPPSNIEIEKTIISIFLYGGVQDIIVNTIMPKWFSNEKLKSIFIKLSKYWIDNGIIGIDQVYNYLESSEIAIIAKVGNMLPSDAEVNKYIKQLKEMYYRRYLWELGNRVTVKSHTEPLLELINEIESNISQIGVEEESLYHISQIIDKHSTEEAYQAMTISCLKTGNSDFDNTVIIKRGDFIILAGRPSMGKTAFALDLAEKASRNESKIGIISLEMRGEYLTKRLAHSKSAKPGYEGYKAGCSEICNLSIWIDDWPKQNLYTLKNKINIMIKKYSIDCVIIDYLTLLDPPKGENRTDEVRIISQTLKQYARTFNIPLIVLSQLNRSLESRSDKRPQLADLRSSGDLEQDADMVMFCYRPCKYKIKVDSIDDNVQNRYFELIIAKQRDGRTDALKYYYDETRNLFYSWEKRYDTKH
ncbi:MAG: AAA family ATPase [Gammaproteobacteria bacterium]|nr:AAA family ATPase [Gammaproteobacteria bacterium]